MYLPVKKLFNFHVKFYSFLNECQAIGSNFSESAQDILEIIKVELISLSSFILCTKLLLISVSVFIGSQTKPSVCTKALVSIIF